VAQTFPMDLQDRIIKHLNLKELPDEGGLFVQSYCSQEQVAGEALPARFCNAHPLGTAIYYLLTNRPKRFSAMHRLIGDEIYHFYLGDPVEMLLLYPDGSARTIILGPDLLNGQQVQFVVPAGIWQGSQLLPGGDFALLGTTMAPGYLPADVIFGNRDELIKKYPAQKERITILTQQNQ
jgi:predicted cupin superfamily sugar epimerase